MGGQVILLKLLDRPALKMEFIFPVTPIPSPLPPKKQNTFFLSRNKRLKHFKSRKCWKNMTKIPFKSFCLVLQPAWVPRWLLPDSLGSCTVCIRTRHERVSWCGAAHGLNPASWSCFRLCRDKQPKKAASGSASNWPNLEFTLKQSGSWTLQRWGSLGAHSWAAAPRQWGTQTEDEQPFSQTTCLFIDKAFYRT